MERCKILGLQIDLVDMEAALKTIETLVAAREPTCVVTADASMVVIAREDPELQAIIERAALVTADGAGLLWAARLFGKPIRTRVSGVDLVERVVERSAAGGPKVYFLGASPGVADKAADNLRARFPGARIVGTQHGYFGPDEEPDVVRGIRDAAPDVLFVAFGIPKQEKFIDRHKAEMDVPVSIGVGGSFDVHSGSVRRAPNWMQNAGMEWLFRLMQNPGKMRKVMMLPEFVLLAFRVRFLGGK